jgi:hypothetical protein
MMVLTMGPSLFAGFVSRQIRPRLPPGPPTGRAFFGAKVHWTFAPPSSPPRRARCTSPGRRGLMEYDWTWPHTLWPYGQRTEKRCPAAFSDQSGASFQRQVSRRIGQMWTCKIISYQKGKS